MTERRQCWKCNGTGDGFKGDTCGFCHALGYQLKDDDGSFKVPCHVRGYKVCNDPRHKS